MRPASAVRCGPRSRPCPPRASTRRLIRSFRPDLIFVWNGAEIPHAAIRVAEYSGAPVAYSVAEHWFERPLPARPVHAPPRSRATAGLRALWAASPPDRESPSRPAPRGRPQGSRVASAGSATRCGKAWTCPETIEPLVERVIYTGVHDPEAWIGLERPPASDPPTIAFVGRLEEQKGPTRRLPGPGGPQGPPRHRRTAQARGPRNAGRAARARPAGTRARHRGSRRAARPRRPGRRGRADGRAVGDRRSVGVAGAVREESASRRAWLGCRWSPRAAAGCPRGCSRRSTRSTSRSGTRTPAPTPRAGPHRGRKTRARTERAFERAREFSFDNYMAQMDEFIAAAVAAPPRRRAAAGRRRATAPATAGRQLLQALEVHELNLRSSIRVGTWPDGPRQVAPFASPVPVAVKLEIEPDSMSPAQPVVSSARPSAYARTRHQQLLPPGRSRRLRAALRRRGERTARARRGAAS